MKIVSVPCLKDNYSYIIICPRTHRAGVVDPSEFGPIHAALIDLGVTLEAILNTHHHWDHVGGNKQLLTRYPELRVYGYGGDRGRIPGQTEFLDIGDEVVIGELRGHISHNPGHTTGAISYYFEDAAFTGDTLFAAGCGRLFEGTPEEMFTSLNLTIGAKPPETRIFFGHEYTENNLRFALQIEPGNAHIKEKLAAVRKLRATGGFTTPSTLAEEWQTNPFMRCDNPQVQAAARRYEPANDLSPASVLGAIRALKDRH